ncbi:MAG: carboxyl-terminal processing protease, partial [Abditibacteriota bacterium]|nr:carboxyl-terminal processing protease [Abditibacteriota bacterium]
MTESRSSSRLTYAVMAAALTVAFGTGYRANQWRESTRSGWLPPETEAPMPLVRTADGQMTADAISNNGNRARAYKPDLKPYETLDEVRRAIKDNFVKTKVDETALTYGAVRGMLRALDDRFTRFLTPEEYEEFNERNTAEFTGIGARIDLKQEYHGGPQSKPFGASRPYIVEPIEGSPAEKAGIKKNDVILAINGRSTADMSEEAAVSFIRGVRGTKVKLKIERVHPLPTKPGDKNAVDKNAIDTSRRDGSSDGTFEVIEKEIARDVIEMHPVKLEWRADRVAWLRLDEFNKKSDIEMGEALKGLQKGPDGNGPAKGLILDMRNNPGGLLDVAVDVGSRFIPNGPIVFTRERNGSERSLNAEANRFMNLKIPIVVLVNKYSASAAEIVTGALKDKDLATVVGETTYGKASVQVLVELKNGGALVITTAKYLTPSKTDISEKGISPDIAVKPSEEDEKTGRGAQLLKAEALIKEKAGKPATA